MTLFTFGKVATAAAVAVIAVLVKRRKGGIYQPPDMHGKTVLITGGTSGLGLESAKRLAKAGASVIITARSDEKGSKAVEAIQEYCSKADDRNKSTCTASYQILHLDDVDSTKAAAKWDLPPIDVLMLNAGIMAVPTLTLTSANVEKQMHTNHLGHFVLAASVEPRLTRHARIVVISSLAYKVGRFGGLDLGYAWTPTEKSYNAVKSYGVSKLANIYFASKLDAMSGYTVVSLHPGVVSTDLCRQLTDWQWIQKYVIDTFLPVAEAIGVMLTAERGANTQLYLATAPTNELVGGGYYSFMKQQKLEAYATDPKVADELWEQSEQISGVKFRF